MYGEGKYSQFGQGSQTPTPHFQQRPVPPPPTPIQQGLPVSQPSIIQQGPPVPPHAGHSAPHAHQLGPRPPIQQGPLVQVPAGGMLNERQSYLPLLSSQQVHGSSSMAHFYPTVQQNTQWTHNMRHIPPPVPHPLGHPPAGPTSPEMFQPILPPRVLPTLPSQTWYRGPVHPPQLDSVQGTQQIPPPPSPPPPPPPPPTSSFFTPGPFGTSTHSARKDSNVQATGSMPPPPLPSSPPPVPPSPPPLTSPSVGTRSSIPLLTSESGQTSNHSGFEMMASDSIDKVVISTQIRDEAPALEDYTNSEGMPICEVGSSAKEDLSFVEGTKLDLAPPPPKPVEENVLQKIETLCHFIAKNGPVFEAMAREKEFGNREFDFLFGGEAGSEAAVAHEYFEWVKKKCILEYKLKHKHNDSILRSPDIDISIQTNCMMDAGVSHSPPDSDMDMEDDITQPDEKQQVYTSFKGLSREMDLIPKEHDIREQLSAPENAVEYSPGKDILSGSSELADQGKGSKFIPGHDHLTYEWSLSKVDAPVMNSAGDAECPLNNNSEKSFVPPLEDLSQLKFASAVAAGIGSEKFPGELVEGSSPFRLLQNYVSEESSEDDDKPCLENVSPVRASPSTAVGSSNLRRDVGNSLPTVPGSKILSSSEMIPGMLSESIMACSHSMPLNAQEFSLESQWIARTDSTSIATVKTEEISVNNNGNLESIDIVVSPEALQQKVALNGGQDAATESGKSESKKEDINYTSTVPKIDEFGRLVREGFGDSDSDESHHTGRRGKRGRSWSRSRSPHHRRRMRRSPWRRKEKRSRSRSWSPKKRRSRSRSPTYRRRVESGGEKIRRDKVQLQECFDFLQGRCYRGAYCRYMHHESNKSDGARRYKGKQHYAKVPPVSRTSDFPEEIEKAPRKRLVHEQDMPGSDVGALNDGNMDEEKVLVSVKDAVQTIISDQGDKSLVAEVAKSESSRKLTQIMQGTQDIKEEIMESTTGLPDNANCTEGKETVQPIDGSSCCPLTDVGSLTLPGDTSHGIASAVENLGIPHSQANLSLPVLQNAFQQPQHANDFSQVQTSTTFQNQLPVSKPNLNKISLVQFYPGTNSVNQLFSSQSLPPKELTPIIPAMDFPDHSQYPTPLPSLSQGKSTPPVPQLPSEHDLMQPTSKLSSLSPSMENCPPYQGLLPNQHSHFSVPPNSSHPLPPPPLLPPQPPFVKYPTVNPPISMQGVLSLQFPSLQFQQNQMPLRNNFTSQTSVRPYPPELSAHSQMREFQHHSYPLMQKQEHPQPFFHREEFRQTLPVSNSTSQPFGGTGLVGEYHFSRFPVQGLNHPNSFAQGNIPPQPVPSLRDSAERRMQPFLCENLPSGGFFTSSSSQNHPSLQPQRPQYELQRPPTDGHTVNLGDYGNINPTMSSYTSQFDKNQPFHVSEFGGSRISNNQNPYASAFDQPLSSKFGSNFIKHENDITSCNNDAPYGSSHVPVDGKGVGSLGSRHTTSSPKSAQAADLSRSGKDQYDPLFDSIEASSNSFKKSARSQKHELINDAAIKLSLSGSHKPFHVEENYKQKDVGVVTENTSVKSENDEFGETEDAEAGDVENVSASNPIDEANTAVGDFEIDQVKTLRKSKKSKDSRSTKLFKVALADFVKEVLKPSWRQGSMSKEAFKTIVKKTVDKVSGAMKSHQIPKSQAKVNQYIDSSQRKLTKLVMGYVQKYVKA